MNQAKTMCRPYKSKVLALFSKPYLFALLVDRELAYASADEQSLVIPHLMPEDFPEGLPSFLEREEALQVRYKGEICLPLELIARLMVRRHQEIKDSLTWRYGVVLQRPASFGTSSSAQAGETLALVQRDFKCPNLLLGSVKGFYRKSYLKELRETLDHLIQDLKMKNPVLEYSVVDHQGLRSDLRQNEEDALVWIPEKRIQTHVANGVPLYNDSGNPIDANQVSQDYGGNIYVSAHNLNMGNQSLTQNNVYHQNFVFLQEQASNLSDALKDVLQLWQSQKDQSSVPDNDEQELTEMLGLLDQVVSKQNQPDQIPKQVLEKLKKNLNLQAPQSKLKQILNKIQSRFPANADLLWKTVLLCGQVEGALQFSDRVVKIVAPLLQ